MKKKAILLSLSAILLLTLILIYYRPIPLLSSASVQEPATLTWCSVKDGRSHNESYVLDSDQIKSLHEILKKYAYHRKLNTFIGKQELDNTPDGMYVITYDGKIISTTGTSEILIDNRRYGLGYFGSDDGAELLEALKELMSGL